VKEVEALEASIAALLDQIRRGELVASAAFKYRLEGASVALNAVLARTREVLERLRVEPQ
jgi:hypothetical protein